jgi:SAM-dependent methyltransferase
VILKSLTDDQVALDFGAGHQSLDDPCIVRMDVALHPYVDVVGDAHALPFKRGSLDFCLGGAVFEHLRQPFKAASELYAALKPGGYVYADWNFVFPYHGYPNHYFNASVHGVLQAFAPFRVLESGVAPFQRPSTALRAIVGEYRRIFNPDTARQRHFARLLDELLLHPLHEYDTAIGAADHFRLAAGTYVFGVKQPVGIDDTVIPSVVMEAWKRRADLRQRFPEPLDLSVPDNVMTWAKGPGRKEEAAIDQYLASLVPFVKRRGQAPSRTVVESWPLELMDQYDVDPCAYDVFQIIEARSRPISEKLRDAWRGGGALNVLRKGVKHAWWRVLHTLGRRL